MGGRILTHSFSSTVYSAIKATAQQHPIEVVATESRPLCEGKELAQMLTAQGISTTLIADEQALTLLPSCDAVWVGADTVAEEFFVNKVGTLAIAKAAHEGGIPLFVLCDSLKFLPEGREYPQSTNPSFEKIPRCYVRAVITEE